VLKFGPGIASNLRKSRSQSYTRWHLDEMVVSLSGKQMYMWRAVDGEGEVLLMGELIWWLVTGFFRSRAMLEAEIVALRHQLNVLRRKAPKRIVFSNFDRLVFASLYRLIPGILNTLVIVKPETVIRWHRAGFRLFRRWKSRSRGGRPKVPLEIRQFIRDISLANPLWGAPRIHGELLKLGIDVGQTSLRHQLNVLQRKAPKRFASNNLIASSY
jgi:DDE domain